MQGKQISEIHFVILKQPMQKFYGLAIKHISVELAFQGKYVSGKEGILRINNRSLEDKDMCNISSYIQQEDVFTESLTVYEHMKFMVSLCAGDKLYD